MMNFLKKMLPVLLLTLLLKNECIRCPYKLGLIKYIKSPCPDCRMKGGKNPPPKI